MTHPALLQQEEDKRVAKVLTLSATVAKCEKRKADAAARKLIPKRVRGAEAIIQIHLPSPEFVIWNQISFIHYALVVINASRN